MAVARIEVEFDDKGATTRVQRLTGETMKANAGQRVVARQLQQEMKQANNAAQLLGGTLGIHLPREINKFLARSRFIGPALSTAFNASVILFFVRGLSQAIVNTDKFRDTIHEVLGPISQLEVKLLNLVGLAKEYSAEAIRAAELEKAITEKGLTLSQRVLEARMHQRTLIGDETAKLIAQSDAKQKSLLAEKARADEINKVHFDTLLAIERENLVLQLNAKLAEKSAEAYKKANAARKEAELSILANQMEAYNNQLDKNIELEKELDETFGKARHDMRMDFLKSQEDAEQEMFAKEARGWDMQKKAIDDVRNRVKESVQSQIDQYERLASSVESFIDRVFLTAKSVGDVFRQFLMQLVGSFVKSISRMIAAALMGMKQTAGAGAGGGLLGALFGGIPAFAGMTGGGGAPGTAAAGSAFAGMAGFGGALPANFAVQPLAGPGISGGATGGLGGALAFGGGGGAAGLASLLPMGGVLGGLLIGSRAFTGGRGPGGGALMGGIGGALIGAGLGAAFFGSVGALAFGPFGAAIGAIVGLIAGIFGRGKAKRKAAAIQEDIIARGEKLEEAFKSRELQMDQALEALAALGLEGAERTRSLGKPGRNAMAAITRALERNRGDIESVERQRQERRWVALSGAIPEFAIGGRVPAGGMPGLGKGILALLHPGEFVMRRSAVDSLGGDFLAALNKAPRFAQGGPVSPQASVLSGRGTWNITIQNFNQAGQSPEQIADFTIRKLRRELADRGVSLT